MAANDLGKAGEQLAARYLMDRGFALVMANWRCAAGEIDLVMRDGEVWVFVEVRARRSDSTDEALASLTPRKRQRMVGAAYAYLQSQGIPDDAPWRIDLVAIGFGAVPRLDYVEDALAWN